MEFNINMNINFGATLITKPEEFFLKTDTEEEKQHIREVFAQYDKILNCPRVKALTENDTVELVRKANKKFRYEINYNSPDLPENFAHGIKINLDNGVKNFRWFDGFFQITNVVAYKTKAKIKFIETIHDYINRIFPPVE